MFELWYKLSCNCSYTLLRGEGEGVNEMSIKRYYEVRKFERKTISVDAELHLLIKLFADKRGISMAEAIHVLIGPAMAALNGLDYRQVLEKFDLINDKAPHQSG